MMGIIAIVIAAVCVVLGIAYHEYGHLIVAKKLGMKVNAYVIGFGKPFLKKTGKDGITYGIAPIPAGGYCDIPSEDIDNAPFWKFVLVLTAGVIRNFIIGTVLCIVGLCICKGRVLNPVEAISNLASFLKMIFVGTFQVVPEYLSPNALGETGGFLSQVGSLNAGINDLSLGLSQTIGLGMIMGGLMNCALAVFNLLPVPAIDGGVILTRVITDFAKNIIKRPIPKKIISRINRAFIGIVLVAQGLYFLIDIPFVRNLLMKI